MRGRMLLAALILVMAAPAMGATVKWRRGTSCVPGVAAEFGTSAIVNPVPGEPFIWCPDNSTAQSPIVYPVTDGSCQFYDAGSGTDLVATFAYTGVASWNVLGGVPCDYGTVGECAQLDLYAGEPVYVTPSVGTAGMWLACGTEAVKTPATGPAQ